MYHALVGSGEEAGHDQVYTLNNDEFARQLDRMAESQGGAGCLRDWLSGAYHGKVLLTFDDGRKSDHGMAFPALAKRGMRADFFVNPVNVGRHGYVSWSDLREMSSAGMSIQSHGYRHEYFTHLAPHALRESLDASRREIEDRVGDSVTLLAPPGGRMPMELGKLARECGYQYIVSSRPGYLRHASRSHTLPRLAVTNRLAASDFERLIAGDPMSILRRRLVYSGLGAAKRLLGDANYEKIRSQTLVRFKEG